MLNKQSVKLALRAGVALGCTIARRSKFDRKQYFYAGACFNARGLFGPIKECSSEARINHG